VSKNRLPNPAEDTTAAPDVVGVGDPTKLPTAANSGN
jgi:hypothetical protein